MGQLGGSGGVVTDGKKVDRARELRNNPTPFEVILWRHLSRSALGGHKFRRQATIEPFIVDFLCPAKALIVEVDGDTHDPDADQRRDAMLGRRGYMTLRFSNRDVGENIEGVCQKILERLSQQPDRWPDPPEAQIGFRR